MNFSALTSNELESILAAFDAFDAAYEQLEAANALPDNDLNLGELADAIADELTRRAQEDATFKASEMVARGELVPHPRPDGEIGYAPPGWMDALGTHGDADWEL